MSKLSLLLFPICTGILMTSQLLVLTIALKNPSNVDEYMVENQRMRMRQNYIMQRALNNEMDNSEIGGPYVSEHLDPVNREELPVFITDYANMRRNDIILLDNSVETRTRRGNIKVEKYHVPEINDVPCNCEENSREPEILGDNYFPSTIENTVCNAKRCPTSYECQRNIHNITVLKRRNFIDNISKELPEDLQKRWVAVKKPVIVGCMCVREVTYYLN